MATVRVEYCKVTRSSAITAGGPDNIISEVLAAEDVTVSGTPAGTAANSPAGTQAVRFTSIGGVAYVNNKTTVSATKGLRLADAAREVMTMAPGKKVSVMTGA